MTRADVALSSVHLLQALSGKVGMACCFFPLNGYGS